MSMLVFILADHLLGLLLWRRFTADEVEVNKVMIEEDKAADTLGAGFHQRRTWIRFWGWMGCTELGALPAAAAIGWQASSATTWWGVLTSAAFWQPVVWSFAALGVLLAGYFLRTFSPSLNAAMKLAYKARFYVSYSATASQLDRFVWWLAGTKLVIKYSEGVTDRQLRANTLFQLLLNVSLVLTLLVYVALLLPLWRYV